MNDQIIMDLNSVCKIIMANNMPIYFQINEESVLTATPHYCN